MKEEEIVKYFNNIKFKYLKEFDVITPNKNHIKGFICKKPNRYLGSLLITDINGKEACQFVQSMPKIHYYDYRNRRFAEDGKDYDKQAIIQAGLRGIVGYEKLDGSCLIIYGLYDPKTHELLEIIPKSRNLPVADKVLLNMYNHIDKIHIEKFFNDSATVLDNTSLFFELYGMLNRHEIYYYQTYIDIKLIGVYENGDFDTGSMLRAFAGHHNFEVPNVLYTIEKNYEDNQWYIYNHCWRNRLSPYMKEDKSPHPDVYDCIQDIKERLYDLNTRYAENNGHRAVEGVVFNGINVDGSQLYIKVKPRDIEIEHQTVNGIPRRSIVKECYKYFDEYGSRVKDIYDKDNNHYIDYISSQLLEEYPREIVEQPKTQKKIMNVFMEVWDARTVPDSIQNICHQLVDENPDLDVPDLMRVFSYQYPQKKRMASTVYQVISSIKKRGENDG